MEAHFHHIRKNNVSLNHNYELKKVNRHWNHNYEKNVWIFEVKSMESLSHDICPNYEILSDDS